MMEKDNLCMEKIAVAYFFVLLLLFFFFFSISKIKIRHQKVNWTDIDRNGNIHTM